MARVKGAVTTRKRRNKVLKAAKGYWGSKSKHFKMAKQAVMKSGNYAFAGRKMKKRFSEKEIVEILQKQKNTGKTIAEICREKGIAENIFYKWKRKYENMTVSEVIKLKSLEDENAKLKRLVAELSLENMVQKDVIKNFCSPE